MSNFAKGLEFQEKFKLDIYTSKLEELTSKLNSTNYNDSSYSLLAKEASLASETVEKLKELDILLKNYKETDALKEDPDFKDIALSDLEKIENQLKDVVDQVEILTRKPLENDEKKAIIEIRPGVGGAEASLFAEDLFRMYTNYCVKKGYKIEVFSTDYNAEGGITEATFQINTPESFGIFRFESGVHRVQRVPKTEALGRIHTSTASVAVLPKFDAKDIQINPSDIRVDVYRSSGPGGQSVNTTDSAVRITHLPTKIIVTCQNGRSQIQNKETAMSILASKLREIELDKEQAAENKIRGDAIGDSERSSKIRTYNFPQGRITDHRIGKSWFNIPPIMDGDLDDVLDSVNQELRK